MAKDIQLKILNGKTTDVEKYEVTGFEGLIPEIRKLDKQIEDLENKRSDMRNVIMNRVKVIKKEEDDKGNLYKTYVIASQDGVPATVLYKNMFSKLDVENEKVMREVLGNMFDEFFEKDASVVLKKKANLQELQNLLGKRFTDFFDIKMFISFAKDFMERRIQSKDKLTKKASAELDKWMNTCQASPDLRLKG